MGEGAEEIVDARELNIKTREMVASIETTIAKSHSEIIEEVLQLNDKLIAIDKRMERMEHVVIGINGDPNSRGIVHRCEDHEKRMEKYDAFLQYQEIAAAEKHGQEIGEAKAIRIHLKNKEITVKWGVALIALIGVIISSTALQTIIDYLFIRG